MSSVSIAVQPGAVTQHKIDRARSQWEYAKEYPLHDTNNWGQEGECMVLTSQTGVSQGVVARSAGAANEKFLGVSISDYRRISTFVEVESLNVPPGSPYQVALKYGSQLTLLSVYVEDAAGLVLTESVGAPGATEFQITVPNIIFNVARAGETFTVRYTYSPTTQQLTNFFYQRPLSFQGQDALDVVTIAQGDTVVYTSAYNTQNTFAIGGRAYTGASGLFTTDATAVMVAGIVVSLPTVNDVYLGVHYNVGTGIYTF